MPIPEKIVALFNNLTLDDIESMPPAYRRRFADACKHWAKLADDGWTSPQPRFHQPPRPSGILAILKEGDRAP